MSPDPWAATIVSPDNAILVAARNRRLALGSTVSDLIDAVVNERQPAWSAAHDNNVRNVLEFMRHVLVYAEPSLTDLPEVAAWTCPVSRRAGRCTCD